MPVLQKNKPLSDKEILVHVQQMVNGAITENDTKLASERKEAADLYEGVLPKPTSKGNSKYVSMDVFDAVEQMKAQILEVFSGNRTNIRFGAVDDDDVEKAMHATIAVEKILMKENNGPDLFHDLIHDGLMSRIGICKVSIDEEDRSDGFEITGTQVEVDIEIADSDFEGEDFVDVIENDDGTITVVIEKNRRLSTIHVEVVPPQDYLAGAGSVSQEDAEGKTHRFRKSRSELLDMGFSWKDVSSIPTTEKWMEDIDTGGRKIESDAKELKPAQAILEQVTVYESYVELDPDGKAEPSTWRVIWAGNVLLEKEPVGRHPFQYFIPLPKAHTAWGVNYAMISKGIQNARSILVRGIIDHTVKTGTPRWKVIKNTLPLPAELLENRHGGIVNVTRADGVTVLEQPTLNPFVFQTIKLLDEDKEEGTGISKLSQGLNKDAISHQNAQDMVGNLVSLSQTRQKIMARRFAAFLGKVSLAIYRLLIEEVDNDIIIKYGSKHVTTNPATWDVDRDVETEPAVGFQEQDQEVRKLTGTYQTLSNDPVLSQLFDMPRRRNFAERILNLDGIKDVDSILMPMAEFKPKPPQPDPIEMGKIENDKLRLQNEGRKISLLEAKERREASNAEKELAIQEKKVTGDHAIRSDQVDLDEDKLGHRKFVDLKELDLIKTADTSQGIASPG